jgi:hypothetical protein
MKTRIAIGSLLCGGLLALAASTASLAQSKLNFEEIKTPYGESTKTKTKTTSNKKPGFKIPDNSSPLPQDRKANTKNSGRQKGNTPIQ